MNAISLDSTEAAALVIPTLVILVGAKWFRGAGRRPPQKTFRHARCSAIKAYSNRTIEAWRSGKG
jgi:hypothetical protein